MGREQLTLGELIQKLESIEPTYDHGNGPEQKDVDFDFASAVPTNFDSWRGDYSMLALGFRLSGYDNQEEHFAAMKFDKFLEHCKETIGETFTGWKGGEYTMSADTDIWVSNPGNSGSTVIVDVIDKGYKIVLITEYQEY